MEKTKLEWWGYKHINGSFQTKRYFSMEDIREAKQSPFCEKVTGMFLAKDREEALKIVEQLTTPNYFTASETEFCPTCHADLPPNHFLRK